MSYVWEYYEKQDYILKDVSKDNRGWDLEATSGSLTLRIEVKGLSGNAAVIELTPNEYRAFIANSHTYKLCIVTGCLAKPKMSVCSFNLASNTWKVEAQSQYRKIEITEWVAAVVAVT